MISDPSSARSVATAAEAFIQELSIALRVAQSTAKPEELEKLKRAIGMVIGSMEVELLWPLYKQHPSLEPENLKGWESGA